MPSYDGVTFRAARPGDAGVIAALHAASWRRHYRGAFADAYLDGDVEQERHTIWAQRLEQPDEACRTVVAEEDGDIVAFGHTILGADPAWGAQLENLHVGSDRKRRGIGSGLLALAAEHALLAGTPLHLWVLEQNVAAQAFYRARRGTCVERSDVRPPGGVAERLNGQPYRYRIVWPDPSVLLAWRP